ncbi:hypothetical protein ABZY05_49710 [Streptomyces canus]|uniref:hypothetical protein n=1 Tax=Streptomyces canus TaxID=58343 RepID=UPI0033A8635E
MNEIIPRGSERSRPWLSHATTPPKVSTLHGYGHAWVFALTGEPAVPLPLRPHPVATWPSAVGRRDEEPAVRADRHVVPGLPGQQGGDHAGRRVVVDAVAAGQAAPDRFARHVGRDDEGVRVAA